MIWSIFIYISWIIVLLKISKTNSIIVIIGQNVAASKAATVEPVRIFFYSRVRNFSPSMGPAHEILAS